jgi:SAM-dependent methyltransferase
VLTRVGPRRPQGFAAVGFPGPDEEYAMATSKLTGARGGTLLDASCGSGLFTRRFVRAGDYRHVVALDFSESMLQQVLACILPPLPNVPPSRAAKTEGCASVTLQHLTRPLSAEKWTGGFLTAVCLSLATGGTVVRIQAKAYFEEENMDTNAVTLVRADIARMPFLSNSLDGVHAGAAIHCWPSPKAAVAEIARVLKPGAVFCGTTFLNPQVRAPSSWVFSPARFFLLLPVLHSSLAAQAMTTTMSSHGGTLHRPQQSTTLPPGHFGKRVYLSLRLLSGN